MLALSLLAILAGSPPLAEDHFRAEDGGGSHVLLVVDARTGRQIRADDVAACESERFPAGETGWLLFALAALQEGVLDPGERIACDSLCWARGGHREPAVTEAIAQTCETFFARTADRLDPDVVWEHAEAVGFAPDARSVEDPDDSWTGWRLTVREWTGFWRAVAGGGGGLPVETASTLLAAAALSVSSPRGAAHALWSEDPRVRVRAIAGAASLGGWVTGTVEVDGRHRWTFALHLRGGNAMLAAERASRVLAETVATYRSSSLERGGEPLPSFRE